MSPAASLLREARVIPVLRGDKKDVLELAALLLDEGFRHLEVTYTVPDAGAAIRELSARADAVVGAGTVTSASQLDEALGAGARFAVSPGLDLDLAAKVEAAGLPYYPGVFTPSEVMAALDAGLSVLKLFPGSLGGPDYLKALKGPFPQVHFMPTGGVSLDNLPDWVAAGAVAVGLGSGLTGGSLGEVRARAKRLREVMKGLTWQA